MRLFILLPLGLAILSCEQKKEPFDWDSVYESMERLEPTRFGLTEKERVEIFREVCKVEAQARREADAKYCVDITRACYSDENLNPNQELFVLLTEQYHQQVREKFELTKYAFNKIIEEGIEQGWMAKHQLWF